ncbi:MAG: hypothetical protein M1824_005275 [Vezdaea acicularis]|nr:MAG: hypothetical protein M1824_005275 [Vezdaea acicularis]
MAKPNISNKPNSSRNSRQVKREMPTARPNVLASCYVVDANTMGPSGIPEVSSGSPSPPESPPLAAYTVGNELLKSPKRRGGAAYTITEECERLFCDTMKSIFLGERNDVESGSRVMGANTDIKADVGLVGARPDRIRDWVELWDYAGGNRFRGFVTGIRGEHTLFIFFDEAISGKDLKTGLMALIELATDESIDCSHLVVCLERSKPTADLKRLVRDLGWAGFRLVTLEPWSSEKNMVSDTWLLLSMDTST